MRTASGSGCGDGALEGGGGVLEGGAGDCPDASGPMMLPMTLSAACCAAAAGKYTLMVTQPASRASEKASRKADLRIACLRCCAADIDSPIATAMSMLRVYTFGGRPLFDHRPIALRRRFQAAHQRRPIDFALMPDHRDVRQAAAFDDGVAVVVRIRIGGDAAHRADAVHQRAAQPDPRIAEGLEHAQRDALQPARDAAATDFGEALDGVLADLAAAVGGKLRLERHWVPVDQFKPID